MHKSVYETMSNSQKKAVEWHNLKTGVYPCNLVVGDYAVVARIKGTWTKVSATWVGPTRIIEVLSDYIPRVGNLLTQATEEIHIYLKSSTTLTP